MNYIEAIEQTWLSTLGLVNTRKEGRAPPEDHVSRGRDNEHT